MNGNKKADPLAAFQQVIGYSFDNPALLRQALTHSSVGGDNGQMAPNYERLEFLGDAVLEVVTSEWLYHRHNWAEGQLTRRRAEIVCEPSLAYIARLYEFGKYMYMNHGEEKTGGRDRSSILCDVVEAVIGAVYLDSSLEEAKALIERLILAHEKELPRERTKDSKSALQEYLQAKGKELPEYRTVGEEGQPHDRTFTVELCLDGTCVSCGVGKSKKEAEQAAAAKAMAILCK